MCISNNRALDKIYEKLYQHHHKCVFRLAHVNIEESERTYSTLSMCWNHQRMERRLQVDVPRLLLEHRLLIGPTGYSVEAEN